MTIAAENKAPSPETIDTKLSLHAELEKQANEAEKLRAASEGELVKFIRQYGARPEAAAQSIRIAGHHHEGLVTQGVTRTLVESRIVTLREYMRGQSLVWLFKKMFEESTKFTLVTGAHDALAGQTLPTSTTRRKIAELFGLCLDVKDQKPKLKVKAIKVKPARKPRAAKAVA